MPTAKAKSKIPVLVDQIRCSVYSRYGTAIGLRVEGAAHWCWANMADRNTVTVVVQGEGGAELGGSAVVTFKGGAMRVTTSAKPTPRWVEHLEDLVS